MIAFLERAEAARARPGYRHAGVLVGALLAVAASTVLERSLAASRYLRRLLESRPQLREEVAATLHAPFGAEDIRAFLSRQPLTDDTLKSALRRLRAFACLAAPAGTNRGTCSSFASVFFSPFDGPALRSLNFW
jgi:hypothetical protein